MTMMVEKEDWSELIQILGNVEKDACSIDSDAEAGEKIEACRQALRSFHATAGMLGLSKIEQAGIDLEGYLGQAASEEKPSRYLNPFGLALSALIKEMKHVANGKVDVNEMNVDEICKILQMDPQGSPEATAEATAEMTAHANSHLIATIVRLSLSLHFWRRQP